MRLVLGVWLLTAFAPASATSIEGVFNTGASEVETASGESLDIRFHPCPDDATLTCGTIVDVLNVAPGDDTTMPDGSPVVGFQMISALEYKGEGKYRRGKINAVDESIEKNKMIWYGLKIDHLKDGELKVRGCISFVCGRTMYWKPVSDLSSE